MSYKLASIAVFVFAIILVNIQSATSLKCIQCTSCTSTDTAATAATCTTGLDTCIKTAMSFPGFSQTTKACVSSSACSAQSFSLFSWGFSVSCCTTDACNGSSNLTPKSFTILALPLAALLYKLFN